MRPYTPRLSTMQLVWAIKADPAVARVDLIPGRRATAFFAATPTRVAIRLVGSAEPELLSLADAKRIWKVAR